VTDKPITIWQDRLTNQFRGEEEVKEPIINIGAPNHLLIIDELWAFISKDDEGNEGLCGMPLPGGGMMPMVCADEARVDSLREMAQLIADNSGHDIVLRKFSNREDLEVFRKTMAWTHEEQEQGLHLLVMQRDEEFHENIDDNHWCYTVVSEEDPDQDLERSEAQAKLYVEQRKHMAFLKDAEIFSIKLDDRTDNTSCWAVCIGTFDSLKNHCSSERGDESHEAN
jgi:hypothetical protein